MKIRYILAALFLITGYTLQAQVPVEPTSATDGGVKIHGKASHFRYDSRRKRSGREIRGTEHQGYSVKKQKPSRSHHDVSEARVFKHHKHVGRRGAHTRMRARHTRKHSLAKK
jgi:hypothetical protein